MTAQEYKTAREWGCETYFNNFPEKVKSKKEKTASELIKEAGQSSHRPVSELIKEAQDRMTPGAIKVRDNITDKAFDKKYQWYSPEVGQVLYDSPKILGRLGVDAGSGAAQTVVNIGGLLATPPAELINSAIGTHWHPIVSANNINRKIHNKVSPYGYRGYKTNGQSWDDIGNDGTPFGRAIKRWSEVPSFLSEIVGGGSIPIGAAIGSTGKALSVGGRGISAAGKGVEATSTVPQMIDTFSKGMKGKVIPRADQVPFLNKWLFHPAKRNLYDKPRDFLFGKPSNPPITDPITKSQLQYISENATNPYNQQFRRMMEQRAIENAPQRAAQMAQSNASNLTSNSASNPGLMQHLRNTWGTSLASGSSSLGSFGGKTVDALGRLVDTTGLYAQIWEPWLSGVGRTLTPQLLRAPAIWNADNEAKERGVRTGQVVGEILPIYNSIFSGYDGAKNTVEDINNSVIKRNNPQQPAN